MAIYAYALIGLIVGIIARAILPSTRLVGLWGSALLGGAGGIIGGLISSAIAPVSATSTVHPLGIVLAVIVSALVSVGLIVITRNKRFA
ncbi:GlsB/YeaQ/YmgE family stress response membrane protein [Archangium violaceum]|uniref:GlsB/YeaQ/YmgE family stress response membrane protein n=1 Tax=Archangium violaceum TaxID=83451 RepID=UPI00193C2BB6|nr:GlsB/YeaQ/YmgE family stress response membrane protein [Archangium violaceum]QRK12875.1 GlsB/YeaQ/YmgE family stress response membrane protein [Archangium violaceum]